MLIIVLPENEVKSLMEGVDLDTGSELSVDLERQTITTSGGREVPFEFDGATRHKLLHGLDDIASTLQHEDAIAAYESAHGLVTA
jgi:3-isopropylmalate/(R)-2-methylmalate dehydratase small subunit